MFIGQDRQRLRQFFVTAWQKHRTAPANQLEPLEALVADVVENHPEYHPLLQDSAALWRDFPPQQGTENPFMHLSMHVALREQLDSDRPPGVRKIYRRLCRRCGEPHQAEHQMLEALGETLWEAGHQGAPPDESRYLERLRRL